MVSPGRAERTKTEDRRVRKIASDYDDDIAHNTVASGKLERNEDVVGVEAGRISCDPRPRVSRAKETATNEVRKLRAFAIANTKGIKVGFARSQRLIRA